MKKQPIILVVDDEPTILSLVKDILVPAGYLVNTASNGKEALAAIQAHPYDLVLTDMIMPQMGGMELVQYLRLHHPETLVIVFTGFASYQDAVDAVKLGAFDYLPKPLQPEILRHAIERALDYQRLLRSQRDLETVFQGAEALGWQAMELVSTTPEAAILGELREQVWKEQDLKEVGRLFLEAAKKLLKVTNSSIFLHDAVRGQFSGLAAMGPESEAKTGAMITAEGVMGYVATHRRPLLVPDLSRDSQLSLMPRRTTYQTNSFMVIPLTGYKFWGVINLADREDKNPFVSRDLFLGWLMGRLLVEILEAREAPEEIVHPVFDHLDHQGDLGGDGVSGPGPQGGPVQPGPGTDGSFSQGEPGGTKPPGLPGIKPRGPGQPGSGLPTSPGRPGVPGILFPEVHAPG